VDNGRGLWILKIGSSTFQRVLEPSWKLFVNFKPREYHLFDNGKMNFGDYAIIANMTE
jgi:hypothetical protein